MKKINSLLLLTFIVVLGCSFQLNAQQTYDLVILNGRVMDPETMYDAPLSVIEEGAYADILLINGDPLKNISILTKPEENLALIMKDGKIYKNTIK